MGQLRHHSSDPYSVGIGILLAIIRFRIADTFVCIPNIKETIYYEIPDHYYRAIRRSSDSLRFFLNIDKIFATLDPVDTLG